MRQQVRRFIRWVDNYTLLVFNPAVGFRQLTPHD
jgi:hypothetical protein